MKRYLFAAAMCCLLLVACGNVRADVINFDDIVMPADQQVPDGYGSTAHLTVGYASTADSMYAAVTYVYFYETYGDLSKVAYSANPNGSMLISFTPASGYQITLNSFDLGQDLQGPFEPQAIDVIPFYISDTAGPGYVFPAGAKTFQNVHSHFNANYTSSGTITLVVGSNWDIGIDNIDYTLTHIPSQVPEPGSLALFASAAMGLFIRRRKI